MYEYPQRYEHHYHDSDHTEFALKHLLQYELRCRDFQEKLREGKPGPDHVSLVVHGLKKNIMSV